MFIGCWNKGESKVGIKKLLMKAFFLVIFDIPKLGSKFLRKGTQLVDDLTNSNENSTFLRLSSSFRGKAL